MSTFLRSILATVLSTVAALASAGTGASVPGWSDELITQLRAAERPMAMALAHRLATDADPGDMPTSTDGQPNSLLLWVELGDSGASLGERGLAGQAINGIDPDNAVGWLWQLEGAAAEGSPADVIALLQRAAAAPMHSDYFSRRLRAFVAELRNVDGDDVGLYGLQEGFRRRPIEMLRLEVAVMALLSTGSSSARLLIDTCLPVSLATSGSCRVLADRVAASRDSLTARLLTLSLLDRLEPGSPTVERRRRAAAWLGHSYASWLAAREAEFEATDDPQVFQPLIDAWNTPGRGEIDVIESVLGKSGVPLQPPDDWVDPYASS